MPNCWKRYFEERRFWIYQREHFSAYQPEIAVSLSIEFLDKKITVISSRIIRGTN